MSPRGSPKHRFIELLKRYLTSLIQTPIEPETYETVASNRPSTLGRMATSESYRQPEVDMRRVVKRVRLCQPHPDPTVTPGHNSSRVGWAFTALFATTTRAVEWDKEWRSCIWFGISVSFFLLSNSEIKDNWHTFRKLYLKWNIVPLTGIEHASLLKITAIETKIHIATKIWIIVIRNNVKQKNPLKI